ncbi:MAG TPA: histidine kinase [Clostridiales bacterium]|nr:histidine kinase [Clostridiales bacterium]
MEEYSIEGKGKGEIHLAFDIATQLIPLLVGGLDSKQNYQRITSILYDMLDFNAVVFIVNDNIEAQSGDIKINSSNETKLTCVEVDIEKGYRVIGTLRFYKLPMYGITDTEKSMVTGIGKLISTQVTFNGKDYYSSLRSKAELKALQAQINPHFLFNALNTISAMCRTEPLTARKLLIHLSNYFRATIETSPDLVEIHKELNTISYYLEIEKARFGDRFDVEMDVPTNMDIKVPPLILQPLVENAIKHGFSESMDKKGKIIIRVKDFETYYEVSVEDNGKGMDDELIKEVLEGGFGDKKIGLYNVHQRLKEVYGEENGLMIESEVGVGTKAIFHVPIRRRSGKDAIKGHYSR